MHETEASSEILKFEEVGNKREELMPINKKEFEDGKLHSKVEEEIIAFLKEREKRAFTSQEIMGGIHLHTEFSTPEITKMSTFAIADFTALLYDMVKKGTITMRIIRNRMHFMIHAQTSKCPKCGMEIHTPSKSWVMTGRADKQGNRTQLRIGLFKCPKHGFFRKALAKVKIPARTRSPAKTKPSRTKKSAVVKKKRGIKQSSRREVIGRRKERKPKDWPLI